MLTRFTVKNFKSFGSKPESISFLANIGRKHPSHYKNCGTFKVLKYSSIYGANASGKTNIITAMAYARDVAVNINGTVLVDGNSYCKLENSGRNISTYFDYEIEIDNELYSYGFEMIISKHFITEEWLFKLEPQSEIKIFQRNCHSGKYYCNKELFRSGKDGNLAEMLMAANSNNGVSTFISIIGQYQPEKFMKGNPGLKILSQIRHWLLNLQFAFPNRPFSGYQCFMFKTPEQIFEELSRFDTGISSIKTKVITENDAFESMPEPVKSNIKANIAMMQANPNLTMQKALVMFNNGHLINVGFDDDENWQFKEYVFEHNFKKGTEFILGEESDGTKRIVDLLHVLLCSAEGSTIIIDELDRSLHPLLTKYFVKEFLRISESKNLQLIISTHESSLLDLNEFRQDEIWFVERDQMNGTSKLIPLDKFKERFDKKIDKAYLDGRYGAIPALMQYDEMFVAEE